MALALQLYEELTEAPDDKTRARLIANAFERMESRYPQIKDLATQSQARETELRLLHEIKDTEARLKLEIKEVEARLALEIKNVEARLALEIKDVEARLTFEIKDVEARLTLEIEKVRKEFKGQEVKLAEARAELVRWVVGVGVLQTTLITGVLLKVAHLV